MAAGRGSLRRLARHRGGNIAVIAALSLPLMVGSLALGVDYGYLAYQKRRQQADTDLAAISAASNIASAEAMLAAYAALNGLPLTISRETAGQMPAAGRMTYTLGRYSAREDLAAGDRFVAGATPFNAVRVRMRRHGEVSIAKIFTEAPDISTEAVAGVDGEAAFSIGSRLASLHGGILNAVLGQLLGTTVSLDVMDYRGLLAADVDVLAFLDQAATKLHLTGVTYDDVLASQVTVGQFVDILAGTKGTTASVKATLSKIAGGIHGGPTLDLARLVDLGPLAELAPGETSGMTAKAGVLDLLSAAGAIANGRNQIALDLGAGVPGLAALKADLAIGEPPQGSAWFAVGRTGLVVRTAQTRLKLSADIGGKGLLSGIAIHLPVYVELAFAEGRLTEIACNGASGANPGDASVTVAARPGVAEAWIGDAPAGALTESLPSASFEPARLVKAPLLSVNARAHVAIDNAKPQALRFTARDIREGTVRSVATNGVVAPLVSSLVGDLDLDIKLAGLGLGAPPLVRDALAKTLAGVAAPLDGVLMNLLAALGIRIGEADIRVTGVTCGAPALLQ